MVSFVDVQHLACLLCKVFRTAKNLKSFINHRFIPIKEMPVVRYICLAQKSLEPETEEQKIKSARGFGFAVADLTVRLGKKKMDKEDCNFSFYM